MRTYLSGAVTGTTDYWDRFALAEYMLKKAGHEVINPVRMNSDLPESATWHEYMILSLAALSLCDTIFMMDGWKKSKGANLEWRYAVDHGLNILYEGGK